MIVLGIRPDIINFQPIVKELKKKKANFVIVHTGQHYSYFFDALFFKQLNFPKPNYHLKIGSGTQAQQLGMLALKLEKVLLKEKPDLLFSFSKFSCLYALEIIDLQNLQMLCNPYLFLEHL